MADTWYFAYGSNLSIDRKQHRTDAIRQAIRCRLPGYRLAFNKQHPVHNRCANIVADNDGVVWGVIYLCNAEAMRKLDRNEGVSTGDYKRLPVAVVTDAGEEIAAVAYIAGERFVCNEGQPTQEYLDHVLVGAREHGLPEPYITAIQRIAAGGGETEG